MATIDHSQPVQTAVEKISGKAWLILSIPWLMIIIGAILNFAIGVMIPSMQEDIGFGAAQAGTLSSISWFITALVTIPLTALINRYGPKLMLTIILFAMGALILVQGAATSYSVLLIARGLGLGLVAGLAPALVLLKQMWVGPSKIVTVNGVEAFTNPAGQVLSTALVPTLLVMFSGWRTTVYFIGGLSLLMAIIWLFVGAEKSYTTKASQTGEKSGESAIETFTAAARVKAIWLLSFAWPGTTLVWIAFFTFWPTFAVEKLGISLTTAGLILSALPIGSIVASLTAPIICDKWGKEKPMIWMWGLILPVCYYAMLATSNTVLLVIASFAAGFGAFAFVPPGLSLPYKIGLNPKVVAMGMAIMMTLITLGGAAGPLIAGNIIESSGDLFKALAICCLSPLTLFIFGIFLPERGRLALEREARKAKADS